jgi:hypothetical protein
MDDIKLSSFTAEEFAEIENHTYKSGEEKAAKKVARNRRSKECCTWYFSA